MKYFCTLVSTILLLVSCRTSSKIEFYGDEITVNYPKQTDKINGVPLNLEDEYTGFMYTYDGILAFLSEKHLDGYVYFYDVENGKRIGTACKIGEGPEEVMYLNSDNCFEMDSNEVCMWLNDMNKGYVMLVDTRGRWIKRINTRNLQSDAPYHGRVYVINDSLLMSYTYGVEIFPGKIRSYRYRLFNYETGEMLKEYKFYSDYEEHENTKLLPAQYLHSFDRIKPDKSKIAMIMPYLNKVNIYDIKSGETKSFGTTNTPDIDVISTEKSADVKQYYGDVECDDKYIYVTEGTRQQFSGRIQVFDWEGNFVRVLEIKNDATDIAFDIVRKILYAKNDLEEVTAYDLNFYYK